MWGELFRGLLTTLRYLAPAAVFALFCAQDTFLLVLRHLDCAVRSVIYPSDEQTSLVLQWLSEVSPVRVTSLTQIWRHGWLLCEALNRKLPGACGGHQEGELSIGHAQSLAEHYLGLQPVFLRKDFECLHLSSHQEFKLVSYINRVRQELGKLTNSKSKPNALRIHHEYRSYTLDYVVRGKGLCVAQTNKKISFNIYPTDQQCLEPGEIDIQINGPSDIFGRAVAPPIYSRAQLLHQAFLGANSEFTQDTRLVTQGATFFRSSGKNYIKKTFFIPKQDIEIKVNVQRDHITVAYLPSKDGVYEISVTSRGYNVIGSPFRVHTSENSIASTSSTETSEANDENATDEKSKRRVVLRIVDFEKEKMILNENGTLEKITEEEAKKLIDKRTNIPQESSLQTDNKKVEYIDCDNTDCHQCTRFKDAAKNVTTNTGVCKIFRTTLKNKSEAKIHKDNQNNCRDIIPDIIVHSMILDENICCAEKTQTSEEPNQIEKHLKSFNIFDCEGRKYKVIEKASIENAAIRNEISSQCESSGIKDGDFISNQKLPKIQLDSSNPFLYDISKNGENTEIPHHMRLEGNNSYIPFPEKSNVQESINSTPDINNIRIVIENPIDVKTTHSNPFLYKDTILKRPKTPVLKITSGDLTQRPDSPFIDPNYETARDAGIEYIGNEGDYLNQFYVSKIYQNMKGDISSSKTDFQVGAMVSSSPFPKLHTSIPEIEAILVAPNLDEALKKSDKKLQCIKDAQRKFDIEQTVVPATPTHKKFERISSQEICDRTNTQSYGYNDTNKSMIDITECKNELKQLHQKDLCDSAYLSNDIFPVRNANKIKGFRNDQYALDNILRNNFLKLDQVEREIWQKKAEAIAESRKNNISTTLKGCYSMQENVSDNDSKIYNSTIPKQFTELETDEHGVTELNNYSKHQISSESLSLDLEPEKEKFASIEVSFTLHDNDNVNSASEITSDVKRHNEIQQEVTISAVQSHATESFLASREHEDVSFNSNEYILPWDDQKMFCDNVNFVMESKKFWDRKIEVLQELQAQEEEKWKLVFKSPKKRLDFKQNEKSLLREIPVVMENKSEISPELRAEIKLVDKWKKFWDDKLETNETKSISKMNEQSNKIKNSNINKDKAESIFRSITITPATEIKDNASYIHGADTIHYNIPNKESSIQTENIDRDTYDIQKEIHPQPEIVSLLKFDTDRTDEELFKAFETNPKRFFGNSRRNIFEKVDTFAENHRAQNGNQHLKNPSTGIANVGIVSNRISMFNIHKKKDAINDIKPIQTTTSERHQPLTAYCNIAAEVSMHVNNYDNCKHSLIKEQNSKVIDNRLQWSPVRETNCNDIETNKVCVNKPFNKHLSQNDCEHKTTLNTYKKKQSVSDMYLDKISNNCSKDLRKFHKIVTKQNHTPSKEKVKTVIPCNQENLTTTSELALGHNKISKLMKTTSKSEIDLVIHTDSKDTYKSCEELNSVKVRNFISIFENSTELKLNEKFSNTDKSNQRVNMKSISTCSTVLKDKGLYFLSAKLCGDSSDHHNNKTKEDDISAARLYDTSSATHDNIENCTNMQNLGPKTDEECRIRFNSAKDFFKSLEEIRNTRKVNNHNLNECELMLYSAESQLTTSKKRNVYSAPTSDCEYEPQPYDQKEDPGTVASGRKLIKISEKFHVDNLFNDVAGDGKIFRRGSFKGIPRKQAVLATFKSMENITDHMTSYEMTESQLSDFARENKIKVAQTHSSEYPYLPNTEPSKYRSRLDNRAYGLISRKELLKINTKPRRNSVPNYLRLNEKFTAEM